MKEPVRQWHDSDVEQLRRMVADNLSNAEISERTGRSVSSIKAKLSRMLLPARVKKQKSWPPEELEQLCFLRDKMKLNFDEIGRRLNRPHSSCYQKYYDFHRKPPKHKVAKESSNEPVDMERYREWRHRQSLTPVSLTASVFNDPLPGYSALDLKMNEAAGT